MAGWDTLRVEVDWTNPPFGPSRTWTDVTADVISVEVTRGRSSALDRVQPGTAVVTLDNRTGAYDPLVTPSVRSLRPVRVYARDSLSVLYTLFVGWIEPDGWSWQFARQDATATMRCVDLLGVLASRDIPSVTTDFASTARASLPIIYLRLGESSGTSARDESLAGNPGTYAGTVTYGVAGALVGDSDTAVEVGSGGTGTGRVELAGTSIAGSWTIAAWCWLPTGLPGTSTWTLWSARDTTGNANTVTVTITDFDVDPEVAWVNASLYGTDGLTHNVSTFETATPASAPFRTGDWNFVAVSYDADRQELLIGCWPAMAGRPDWAARFAVPPWGGGVVSAARLAATSAGTAAWPGRLDEFVHWDRAVGFAELEALWRAGAQPPAPEDDSGGGGDEVRLWDGDTTATRFRRLCAAGRLDAAMFSASPEARTVVRPTGLGSSLVDLVGLVADSEGSTVRVDQTGLLVLDGRHAPWWITRQATSQTTISDNSTTLNYSDIGLDLSHRAATIVQVSAGDDTASAVNTAAVSSSGAVSREVTTECALVPELQARARMLLTIWSDEVVRVERITIEAHDNATLFDQVVRRDLLDRVTVEYLPPRGGTPITVASWIDQISHTIEVQSSPRTWTTTWTLSPVRGGLDASTWMRVGHATQSLIGSYKLAP